MSTTTKYAYLTMIDPSNNTNKFYQMEITGGRLVVTYGKIGAVSPSSYDYNASEWDKKYKSKIDKGYVDSTHLHTKRVVKPGPIKTVTIPGDFTPIPEKSIRELIDDIRTSAGFTVSHALITNISDIPADMIDTAIKKLNKMEEFSQDSDIVGFNEELKSIFIITSRNIGSVNDYIAKTIDDFAHIMKRERQLMNIINSEARIKSMKALNNPDASDDTILDAIGVKITESTVDEFNDVRDMFGNKRDSVMDVFKVIDLDAQSRFNEYKRLNKNAESHLLWHGCLNNQVFNVLETGLKIEPANTISLGKSFGKSIYLNNELDDCIDRTSFVLCKKEETSYIFLVDTAFNKVHFPEKYDSKFKNLTNKTLESISGSKSDCISTALINDYHENATILYNENQCTVKYIIELKKLT